MKKPISTTKAPAAIGPYSQAIQWGDVVFISGQVAFIPGSGELN
ncbi:Rid family hydrolase, partial [Gammaproteobacteria bacterium]|nr:Rid family hydrolase [Gammaproteobacteria bacterium]